MRRFITSLLLALALLTIGIAVPLHAPVPAAYAGQGGD